MNDKIVFSYESTISGGQQFHQYQQNKESTISGGQQFHQYQQNEQPPLTLSQLSTTNTTTHDLGQAQQCDRVISVNGITTLPSV